VRDEGSRAPARRRPDRTASRITGTPFAFYPAAMQRGGDTALAAALAWLTARAHRTAIEKSPA
jgi:hypothetical protein